MSIIKHIMDNDGSGNHKKGTEAKNCTICQAKFAFGKDDFRIAHCAECIKTDRVRRADYWRNEFMQKRANTLSPDMEILFQKLADQKEAKQLLEGRDVTTRGGGTGSVRQFNDIASDQQRVAASFELVRSQVMEYLPAIVAEFGLSDKIDIELFADMIVPAKISTPLVETRTAKAAIRSIVFEEINRQGLANNLLSRTGEIVPRGKESVIASATEGLMLEGGIQRVDAASNFARQIRADAFSPTEQVQGVGDPNLPPIDDSPIGNPSLGQGDPQVPGMDSMGGLPGDSMSPNEVVGDVVRIPDESAMPPDTSQVNPGGMPTMNEGIIPNSEEAFYNQSPDLGQEMPAQEGAISRVQQGASPRVRALSPKIVTATKKPTGLLLHNVVGRVAKNVPVQAIKLEANARFTLDNSLATNQVVASYNDGVQNTWSYYKTDKGYIFTSASSEFYAETPQHFVAFLSSDQTFKKFAFLPEELMTQDEPSQGNPAEMALPGQGDDDMNQHDPVMLEEDVALGEGEPISGDSSGPMGSPSVNEIEPTVLSGHPGIMDDLGAIFDNSGANVAPDSMGNLVGDALADEAANMLPQVQQQYPSHSPEEHLNHAVACATAILYGLYSIAAGEPYAKDIGETHSDYINRLNQLPDASGRPGGAMRAYRNEVMNNPSVQLEDFMHQYHNPSAPVPYTGDGEYNGPVVGPHEEAAYDAAIAQHPPVPNHSIVRKEVEGPNIGAENALDIPADKQRNMDFQETLSQMPAQPLAPAAPKYDVVPGRYKGLSDKEPAGVTPIPDEELNSPEFDAPALPEGKVRRGPKAKPAPGVEVAASLLFPDAPGTSEAEWQKVLNHPINKRVKNNPIPPSNKGIPPVGGKGINYGIPPVAASLIQLAEEVGETSEEEFANGVAPGMVEAGYTDDEIMTVYALLFKEADGDGGCWADNSAVQDAPVGYKENEVTEEVKRGLHGKVAV